MPTVQHAAFRPGSPKLYVGCWPFGIAVDSSWKLWAVKNETDREALLGALGQPIPTREDVLDLSAKSDAAVCRLGTGDLLPTLYIHHQDRMWFGGRYGGGRRTAS